MAANARTDAVVRSTDNEKTGAEAPVPL